MIEGANFAEDFIVHFKNRLEFDGRLTSLTNEDYRIIRLEMVTAFRKGYDLACRNDFHMRNSYSEQIDMINRKLLRDVGDQKIAIDDYRKISRGLDVIAQYLDNGQDMKGGQGQ